MKQILISIKPEWVAKILNGEKTIEIRKTKPNEDNLPCEVFIYCSKDKGSLYEVIKNGEETGYGINDSGKSIFVKVPSYKLGWGLFQDKNGKTRDILNELCGKVVAKFTLNRIERFGTRNIWREEIEGQYEITGSNISADEIESKSCLNWKELDKYSKQGHKNLYAWYIDDLQIFDKPFYLSQQKIGNPETDIAITKAPQSWYYCEYDEENRFLPF